MAVSPHCQHLHCAELASLDRAPQTTRRPRIQAFAGRVGGNQALVLNERDEQNADVLRKIPDSALSLTWSASLDLSGFLDIDLWRLALVECIGMSLQLRVIECNRNHRLQAEFGVNIDCYIYRYSSHSRVYWMGVSSALPLTNGPYISTRKWFIWHIQLHCSTYWSNIQLVDSHSACL